LGGSASAEYARSMSTRDDPRASLSRELHRIWHCPSIQAVHDQGCNATCRRFCFESDPTIATVPSRAPSPVRVRCVAVTSALERNGPRSRALLHRCRPLRISSRFLFTHTSRSARDLSVPKQSRDYVTAPNRPSTAGDAKKPALAAKTSRSILLSSLDVDAEREGTEEAPLSPPADHLRRFVATPAAFLNNRRAVRTPCRSRVAPWSLRLRSRSLPWGRSFRRVPFSIDRHRAGASLEVTTPVRC